jgi:hypothetical protein
MTDQSAAPSGGSDISVIELPNDAPESFADESAAARYFASLHDKKPEKQAAESADDATAEQELSGEDNAAPPEEAHGEDQEIDPVEPLIDRPKSWTEAEDAEWRATPRALQQKIVARELERDTAIRRAQNDAAEKLKGLTAKEQQLEQARQQYETKLSSTVKFMEQALQSEFGDIQTLNDVRKLQAEDPFRFQAWQVRQMELTSAKAEESAAEQRQAHERQLSWNKFVQDESAAFADSTPDYTAKKDDYDKKAADVLREIGFTGEELNRLASGEEKIPLFDRRIQRLLYDRIRLSEIKSAPKAVVAPNLPPVQRPGTARPQGHAAAERAQALDKSLTNSGDFNDAVALLRARRGSR